MKHTSLLFILILLVPCMSFAQRDQQNYQQADRVVRSPLNAEASALTVFSETGEQFFLVLNGIRQNTMPQSRVRVEQLPQYMNDVQIIFADNRTPELQNRVTIADPIDGKAANMTLVVERNREGRAKLKFSALTPVDHNYHAIQNEYIMPYGQPQQVNQQPQEGTTQTTTTYTDPNTGQVISQTTTTINSNTPPPPPAPAGPVAMDAQSFGDMVNSISNASFEDTKLSTAKTILASNFLTTDQVMQVCKLFSFEDSKVAFAKFAYSKTVDPNNYYKVANVFDFDADKQALNAFISNGGR